VRVTAAFCRLLRLAGIWVRGVAFEERRVVVTIALRRRRLECPDCGFSATARYDTRPVLSRWRHLDLGAWRLEVVASLRRISCPTHGQRTEGVPFARPGSRFTRDFEDLVAFLATRTDQTTIARLMRIDWETVGRICGRVVATELDPGRLDDLFEIGIDEISWKKHHHYLTLVADHRRGKVVWAGEHRGSKTLDGFFDELGEQRSAQLTAVSLDMTPSYRKSIRAPGHAPQAIICTDPFHVVALATKALEKTRRQIWQDLRSLPDPEIARRFKGARWALLKNPENLTDTQAHTLNQIRKHGGALWRAYQLKEALRAVFAGDLSPTETADMIDRWCQWAQRSRLQPFITTARTIRTHRNSILAAIHLGINNGRLEGLNNRVRLIMRRAFGFHSAQAAIALLMLSCGPIQLHLPHETT
jgi:transposase